MTEEARELHDHVDVAEPVRDVYLNVLLGMLNGDKSHESALSVTVQVGGLLVAGELISHGRWEAEFRAWLATIGGDSDALVTMLDVVNRELGPPEEDESKPLNFLHLRNAKFITNHQGTINGPTAMGPERPLWRARIADVEGWTLGRPD